MKSARHVSAGADSQEIQQKLATVRMGLAVPLLFFDEVKEDDAPAASIWVLTSSDMEDGSLYKEVAFFRGFPCCLMAPDDLQTKQLSWMQLRAVKEQISEISSFPGFL